ncbi:MAG: cyclase family protein [Clostridia bacterium]|nr:cyclase family protein [Clostridia bacterium]
MIYDITRELLSTPPYPGEAGPVLTRERDMARGDYNLSRIEMSLHAGTHIDAPLHYIEGGADAASTDLTLYSGSCFVLPAEALDALRQAPPRLLLRGEPALSPVRIEKLIALGVRLLGVETQSVGTREDERGPHVRLLSAGVALLENIDLAGAPDGPCVLCAFPLRIAGAEASPCRAVLFV